MHHPQAQWLEKAQCQELILRSASHVDAGQALAFSELFTVDAVLIRPSGDKLVGREAIRDAYASRPAGRITRHLLSNIVVEFCDENTALARSYVLLWSTTRGAEDESGHGGASPKQAVGEFADRLVKLAGGLWLIQARHASFVM
ncbi:MAG: hypothetical protein GAK30_00188 [Paracidovorax wautersii]|uniref:SnoaL-like domain-containing protein n=1 Tax=Paracidovorax wautersii TaxID=1177982 RepID=A0A7V8FS35_9BURK|nr:MAG: hypothetical protein GAK30_00188 [Paracidovorax wautersii]